MVKFDAFNPSRWIYEFKARLIYKASQDSQGYPEKSKQTKLIT